MLTSLIFVVSLILLLRRFKSKRSRMVIGVLYCSFLIWYVQVIFNYGKYTLQPGQSVELRVHPNTEQVEFYSELILAKKDKNKIKLTGSGVWSEQFGDITYGVEEQKITKIGNSDDDDEELPNTQKDMLLVKDGVIVSYQGEKIFDVTNNKPYTITITNVDDKAARFEAQVADH